MRDFANTCVWFELLPLNQVGDLQLWLPGPHLEWRTSLEKIQFLCLLFVFQLL